MIYDGTIAIATGLSASSKTWKNEKTTWGSFVERIYNDVKTSETLDQFLKAPKDEQGQIKDVGGYVGGFLLNGRRKPENVLYRQLLTLDIDFAHDNFWDDFLMVFDNAAILHATHKSSVTNRRYRLLMPLSREVSSEEYIAIARKVAGFLNIDLFDNTTFETNRLMFWPSTPIDQEYYCVDQDGPWVDADKILATYNNWHDSSEWPTAISSNATIKSAISKQEDPCEKKGIVGIFCRTYSIEAAIEAFLSDVYVPATDGRYSYTKGSTSAGLTVYDGMFAYSHHSTDPACSRLCNAFDLVRIHKYGHMDGEHEKTTVNSKSYKAMEEFAASDSPTKRTIATEKFAEARFEFIDEFKDAEMDISWTDQLEANTRGDYENSATNINIILQNDHMLKGAFNLNLFDNKRYVTHSLPWRKVQGVETLRDVDYAGVRNYVETVYGVVASGKIDDALALEFEKASFHPIKEYIMSVVWDGKPRIETLMIDYFGTEDNKYTRASIKKTLVGAIARIMEPGIKFDLVLTIIGGQGTGKSTFVKKLGKEWFSDTFLTVQGKEALEQIQGAWIIEMAELSGLRKAEVETVKHFISKYEDMYRPAYGRVTETYKRQCIFIGTTNNKDFLRDPSGNRRFMPIDVNPNMMQKSVFTDLTPFEVDQIWAEAFVLYKKGELLYLVGDEEMIAKEEQRNHIETDERRGIIDDYVNTLLPTDWDTYDIFKRKDWLSNPEMSVRGTVERVFVCIAEIWCECLGKDKTEMSRYNTRDINEVMKSLNDWEFINSTKNFNHYGKQKYYARRLD